MKALEKFQFVSLWINNILRLLDPNAASQYQELNEQRETPYLKATHPLDPCYWPGRMLLFNLKVPPYLDKMVPPSEWAPLHTAGTFTTGGSLLNHDLNLRLRYLPYLHLRWPQ